MVYKPKELLFVLAIAEQLVGEGKLVKEDVDMAMEIANHQLFHARGGVDERD